MLVSQTKNRNAAVAPRLGSLLFTVLAACASEPAVRSVATRYVGASGFQPVSPASVEVVKGPELRPHEAIAELELPADGSSFDVMVQRLRERAAALGADAIVDVNSIYDTPGGLTPTSSNTDLSGDASKEAAKVGVALLIKRPKFVSVRAVAVRLQARHADERSYTVHDKSDSRPSPTQDAHRGGIPVAKATGPGEKKPVDQPR
jgi:hypothetical protein